jgi:hypothetical protein
MSRQGTNVKKLIVHKMAVLMIPPGTANPLGVGVAALVRPGNLAAVAREATAWVEQILTAVKAAPDNPYGTDDEAIAGEILRQIEARKRGKK